jgi:hypothetical protein
MVYKSRFTPGLENGQDVSFKMGEQVLYGKNKVKITIDSDIVRHDSAPGDGTGYESIFHDTGERAFASRLGIVEWDDKVV